MAKIFMMPIVQAAHLSVFTIICGRQECVIVTTGELKKNP
jgi:hypothetical protein